MFSKKIPYLSTGHLSVKNEFLLDYFDASPFARPEQVAPPPKINPFCAVHEPETLPVASNVVTVEAHPEIKHAEIIAIVRAIFISFPCGFLVIRHASSNKETHNASYIA